MGQPERLPPLAELRESNEDIDGGMFEIHLYGFALAKIIATNLKKQSGVMECPLCGQDLRFSIAPNNGHMGAKCARDTCISMRE